MSETISPNGELKTIASKAGMVNTTDISINFTAMKTASDYVGAINRIVFLLFGIGLSFSFFLSGNITIGNYKYGLSIPEKFGMLALSFFLFALFLWTISTVAIYTLKSMPKYIPTDYSGEFDRLKFYAKKPIIWAAILFYALMLWGIITALVVWCVMLYRVGLSS